MALLVEIYISLFVFILVLMVLSLRVITMAMLLHGMLKAGEGNMRYYDGISNCHCTQNNQMH